MGFVTEWTASSGRENTSLSDSDVAAEARTRGPVRSQTMLSSRPP